MSATMIRLDRHRLSEILGPIMLLAIAVALGLAAPISTLIGPSGSRLMVATAVVVAICAVALRNPRHGLVVLFLVLPLLGFVRRVLLSAGLPWTALDPLLVVGPVVSMAYLGGIARRQPRRLGRLRLIWALTIAMVLVDAAEIMNPAGGGLLTGLTGFVFVAGPVAWLFIGYHYGDGRFMRVVILTTVVAANLIAVYGLSQTEFGLLPWDSQWISVAGYVALRISGALHAFGTFASSAEYAAYMGIGFSMSLLAGIGYDRRLLVAAPLPGGALVLTGERTALVLTVFAVALCAIALAQTAKARLMTAAGTGLVVTMGGAGLAYLGAKSNDATSTLVGHQLTGILNPLDPGSSTFLGHLDLVVSGIRISLMHPLGLGIGVASQAGRFGGELHTSEWDLSNQMITTGIVGGALFLAILTLLLVQAIVHVSRSHDWLAACCLAILIVALGQWLNGGWYAVIPLLWLAAGWLQRQGIDGHSSVHS